MTKGTIGLIYLTMFLTLTVLTGGGWAEDWLGDNKIMFMDKEPDATITAPKFSTTNDISIKYDREKFDKLVFHEIEYYKQICFKLKGDDTERCVETEWLYKWLRMMQP